MTPFFLVAWLLTTTRVGPPAVAIDLRPLPERAYRTLDGLALERKLALRLVQEGFAVVGVAQPSVDLVLSVHVSEHGYRLEVRGASGQRSARQVTSAARASVAELHLELIQKAAELCRGMKVSREQPPREVSPGPAPVPALLRVPVPAVLAAPERTLFVDLSLLGSAVLRGGGVDPLLMLQLAVSGKRLGGILEAGESFSGSSAIHVLETEVLLGVTATLLRTSALQLRIGLEGALVLHHFEVTDPIAVDRSATLFLFGGQAPLSLQWFLGRHLSLQVRAAAGFFPGVTHLSEGQTLWSRGGFRGETGAGVAWSF